MTGSADSDESKKTLRRKAATRRKRAFEESGPDVALRLAEHLLGCAELASANWVSSYWPMREEIDPRPVMEALNARGVGLCLPVVTGHAQPLIFRAWQPGDRLVTEAFGTSVPMASAHERVPEILLVPLLAFDSEGYRLGYGGGFYDRTLEKLRSERGALAIGLAFAGQHMDFLPRGPHDQKLDMVVTEQGVQAF
ncbi:5-formyltetrahydrofolate cyclo-ligase [Fodinicurvata sediminis]|uniref:5-formyltetrahydrofolate cyclo-ligase n=1 Tax=Fodinicurvata sediminis TaxID=1121832 RepID=UPI0003B5FB53|nr:5-formyltetrahydrofolate cyclo-ligase [Fodinicurvata sediminis]